MSNSKADPNKKRGKGRSRGRGRKKKVDLTKFWGDTEALPHPSGYDPSTPDTTAVVGSLGRVPIPGQEAAAHHFFQLVYNRAAGLATALAVAGQLEEIGVEPVDATSGVDSRDRGDDHGGADVEDLGAVPADADAEAADGVERDVA